MPGLTFDEQLERFISQLAFLVTQSAEAVSHPITCLEKNLPFDAELAESREENIDALSEEIAERALALLACFAPLGRDLRLLTSGMMMSREAERIGDHGHRLGRMLPEMTALPQEDKAGLIQMGRLTAKMTSDSFAALVQEDVNLIKTLFATDDEVDDLYLAAQERAIELARDGQPELGGVLRESARTLERVGDHSLNLGESVYSVLTGCRGRAKDFRRPKGRKKEVTDESDDSDH